jgi:hypothetical protein
LTAVTNRAERAFLWCGVAGGVLLFTGLLVGHLLPPPSPAEGAVQVTAFYRAHASALRWGSILMGFGAALFGPWLAVLTKRLRSIEGHGAAAAYCELALGALLVFEVVLPVAILQVVLFRLARPPDQTLLLSDLFLILFISPAYTFVVELLVTAAAVLWDRATPPVFPRWIAGINVVTAILSLPGVVVIFVRTGPFRWNGLLGFWAPAVVFGVWIAAMTAGMLQVPAPADQAMVSAPR